MGHLVHFSIGAFLLLAIKSYIFYTFSLIGILWLYRFFLSRIGHYIIKLIIRLIVMVGIIWLFIYFIAVPDNFIQQLLADALTHGEHLQEYMTSINETYGGSGYTLPSLDLNAGGIIQTFFLSLNVTLFRSLRLGMQKLTNGHELY